MDRDYYMCACTHTFMSYNTVARFSGMREIREDPEKKCYKSEKYNFELRKQNFKREAEHELSKKSLVFMDHITELVICTHTENQYTCIDGNNNNNGRHDLSFVFLKRRIET